MTLVDTGDDTQTGGRLKRVARYIEDDEAFCFTYGDGLSDVNIGASIEFHRQHGRHATVTAVLPPGRYGAIECKATGSRAFSRSHVATAASSTADFSSCRPRYSITLTATRHLGKARPWLVSLPTAK